MYPHINYVKLVNLVTENPNYLDLIRDNYLLLLSQLTKTTFLYTDVFTDIVNKISTMGVIYVGVIGKPSDDNFEIIATGTLIIEPKLYREAKSVGHIEDIIVTEYFRGCGVSQKILDLLKEEAIQNNCYKVILNCHDKLQCVYYKNGLSLTGCCMSKYF